MQLEFTVKKENDGIVLRSFLRLCGMSTSLLRSVKYAGGYFKNGMPVHTNEILRKGDVITFTLPEEGETAKPENIPLDIVYEDRHVMLLNKPAYMTVHPTIGYPSATLANAFCGEMQRRGQNVPFRCIGRLDRNTSGLVLCALNAYSAALLEDKVNKTYLAIAEGNIKTSGTVDAPIGLCDDSYVKHCVREDGKRSVTHYEVISANEKYSLLRLTLETGRTHQIRVHMAHIGHPLAGDDFYGGSRGDISRHALHCEKMQFINIDTGSKMQKSCKMPQDMCTLAQKYKLI